MSTAPPGSGDRMPIIAAVANPLNFMTLAVLIVEVIILSLLTSAERAQYFPYLLGLLVLLVLIVTGMAIWRPEALKGVRPFEQFHAAKLADDIYISIDPYLQNGTAAERAEAWQALLDTLRNPPVLDSGYVVWALAVAAQLEARPGVGASRPVSGPVSE